MNDLARVQAPEDFRNAAGQLDPQRIGAHLERLGQIFTDLQHAATLLAKTDQSVLAALTLTERDKIPRPSLAEARVRALASDTYQDHVYALTDARWKSEQAKVTYQAAQAMVEAARTAEVTRRAELHGRN